MYIDQVRDTKLGPCFLFQEAANNPLTGTYLLTNIFPHSDQLPCFFP